MSNISNQIIPLIFNVITILGIIINILFLISFNRDKCFIPFIVVCIYFICLILFQSKILITQEFLVLLMCYNANLIDKKKFVRYNIIFTILPFIMMVILYLLNIIPSESPYSIYLPGFNKGNGLGFIHPNNTGEIVIGIIISLLLLLSYYRCSFNDKHYVHIYIFILTLSLFITIIFYKITSCRELLYFESIIMVLLLLGRLHFIKNIIYSLLIPLVIVIPLLTIYWDNYYDQSSNIYETINRWSSGRISIQNSVFQEHPIHLLQTHYNVENLSNFNTMNGSASYVLDNSFADMTEVCGIIGVMVAIFIIMRVSISAIRTKSYVLCVVILALIICNCIESSLFNSYLDAPLIYVSLICGNKLKFIRRKINSSSV